jgi:starch synthase
MIPQRPLKVLFAASEIVPYAKTGGLADVVGALPQALMRLGCEVAIVMPCPF